MRAGTNPVDILCDLPSTAPAGSFIVTDQLGRSQFAYCGFGQSSFYEVNLYTGALRRLENFPAGLTWGAGVCATYDANNDRVHIVGPGAGAAFAYTGYYDVATDNWWATGGGGALDVLLAGEWGTDGSLIHLGSAMSAAYSGDYLLLRGSATNAAYRFGIAGDAWAAAGVPGAASNAGVTLVPIWSYGHDFVYSTHGTPVPMLARYSVTGNNWPMWMGGAAFTDVPATGTSAVTHPDGALALFRLNATGQIIAYDPAADTLSAYTHIYGTDGTATVGSKLCAYKQNDDTYLVVLLHNSTKIQRIRIVE